MVRRLLRVVAALALAGAACSPGRPPDVVLVVFEAARADRFGAYGHARPTTPHFDALARDSLLFEQAFATSNWSLASHASLFTGLHPLAHGATQEHPALAAGVDTLAGLLGAAGYDTAAFPDSPWVGPETGLLRGFAHVGETRRALEAERVGDLHEAVARWLDGERAGRPVFLFVHLAGPDSRYRPPAAQRDRFVDPEATAEELRRADFSVVEWYLRGGPIHARFLELRRQLYDAELAAADAALGGLLELLRARGRLERSLIVVTADHGESLGDHGHQGHVFALTDPIWRVPLLVRPPGGVTPGVRRSDPVQLTDVFATVVAAAGLPSRHAVGRDLLSGPAPAERLLVAEAYLPEQQLVHFPKWSWEDPRVAPYRRRLRALRFGSHKLVWSSDGRHELYDLAADPGEMRDLAAAQPSRVAELSRRLEAWVERHAPSGEGGPPSGSQLKGS